MKIKKLLLSICMFCLAVLVMGGATVPAMQFGAQAMSLRTAGEYNALLEPKELFDSKGNYNVDMDYLKTALEDGQVFNFFGYDWRLVFLNEKQNVATFYMADPFTGSVFNQTKQSNLQILKNGENIWSNGYTSGRWVNEDGETVIFNQSKVRELLIEAAGNIIDNKDYAKYKNKVVAGYVNNTNELASERNITLAFSKLNLDHVSEDPDEKIIAQYGLSDVDRLWLPTYNELTKLWKVDEGILQWKDTTNNGGYAWLRDPYSGVHSAYIMCLSATRVRNTGSSNDFFTYNPLKQEAGVRPAIHLDITDLTAVKDGKGGWFNEDWLKTLFIVVCVLGIVGIGLVITAVVLKSRQKQAK